MFDPDAAEKARLAAAESRRFNVHTEGANHDGTIHVEGDLDLADALDLEAAIAQRAEELRQLGSSSPSTFAAPSPPARSPGAASAST